MLANGWSFNAAARIKRDIVIEDSTGRIVYRAGPYNSISVVLPWNQLLTEINEVGLSDLLARLRIRYPNEDPIVVKVPGLETEVAQAAIYNWQRLRQIFGRRS